MYLRWRKLFCGILEVISFHVCKWCRPIVSLRLVCHKSIAVIYWALENLGCTLPWKRLQRYIHILCRDESLVFVSSFFVFSIMTPKTLAACIISTKNSHFSGPLPGNLFCYDGHCPKPCKHHHRKLWITPNCCHVISDDHNTHSPYGPRQGN